MDADPNLRTRTATIRGGIRIPCTEHGDPGGVPMLLVHGYSDSWRSFEAILPRLPPSIRAIALSQRGHGDADRPRCGYGAADLADDLAALLDALGLARAVVVGHSMGSYVAQRFAIDHPDRVLGLVLAGSYSTTHGNAGVEELAGAVMAMNDPVDPAFVRAFQESTISRPVDAAFVETVIAESMKLPAHVWRECAAAIRQDDHRDRLAAIAVPTLILWGDQDAFFPRSEQDALAATIPGARLVVYPGTGHALHWEEPERFAADIADFASALRRPD